MSILNFLLEIVDTGVVDNAQSGNGTPANYNTITINYATYISMIVMCCVLFSALIYCAVKLKIKTKEIENIKNNNGNQKGN